MKKVLFPLLIMLVTIRSFGQCACCAGAGVGSSNGDYNNGILTLKKNQVIAETYGDYRTVKDGDAIVEDEQLLESMFINTIGIRYGVTDKITVSTLIPYVTLNTNSGSDAGIGDLIVLGTFNIFAKNNLNLALQAGVELPTGIQKPSDFDNSTVVVGSGSFDPIIGVIVARNWKKTTLQANGLYKHTTSGFHGNDYGSLAVHNLSLSYALKSGSIFCATDAETQKPSDIGLNIHLGYYGEWLDKLTEDDAIDEVSGYYLGFANIGSNFSYKKWSFPLTFSLPLVEEMNGSQNDAGFRCRLGIIKSF